jgi:diadenosine tetraphosphate (Ap4A) HIT family hydrolase
MTTSPECSICLAPVNGTSVIDVGSGWSLSIPGGHAPLPGWVTLHHIAHRVSPDELTESEGGSLGRLIRAGSAFLRSHTGAPRVYVANWAEATPHVHFHLIPRPLDLRAELRGAQVFSLMSDAPAPEKDGAPSGHEQIAVLQELGDALRRKDAS